MGSVRSVRLAVATANKADTTASPSNDRVKDVKWALSPITMEASTNDRPEMMVHINYYLGSKKEHAPSAMTLMVGRRVDNWICFIFSVAKTSSAELGMQPPLFKASTIV